MCLPALCETRHNVYDDDADDDDDDDADLMTTGFVLRVRINQAWPICQICVFNQLPPTGNMYCKARYWDSIQRREGISNKTWPFLLSFFIKKLLVFFKSWKGAQNITK